jgi:two-component system cell cycle sensor histidine kinase PleC
MIARRARHLEGSGPKANLLRPRLRLFLPVSTIGHGKAFAHHHPIKIHAIGQANDQQALEAVPLSAHTARIGRRHQALQHPLGLLSALPCTAGTLACLAEFRRIDAEEPHSFLAGRQAVAICRMELAGMRNLDSVIQFCGNKPEERQNRQRSRAIAYRPKAARHAFASLKNKSLAKMANIFLRIAL